MSLRLRLALWYGGLTGLVVLLVSLFTYALHTRAHYDDLDFALLVSTNHIAEEYTSGTLTIKSDQTFTMTGSLGMVMRFYGTGGELVAGTPNGDAAPEVDPLAVVSRPSRSPFDPVVGIAPPLTRVGEGPGTFGMVSRPSDGRWRVYAVAAGNRSGTGYFVGLAPLDRLDSSVDRFRQQVIAFAVLGTVVTFAIGWLLAGRALRPVVALTETARAIAHSRELSRRVPISSSRVRDGRDAKGARDGKGSGDELGQLAATFNEMLASVEQAYQAQQRFVSDASHELRAPLTAIQGNLELLERRPDMAPAERKEAVSEAGREARRLARLVADLLALARADAGVEIRRERVELDRVVLDALAKARHLARGQHLSVAELEPLLVRGDSDRLEQLLIILLDNAIKYTPSNGNITVELRQQGGRAEVVVRDTGIGIPAQDLPHVFDRFYRADPARSRDPGGTGLGLAIARWIAEQHGGRISIQSEPGRGTATIVTVPLFIK